MYHGSPREDVPHLFDGFYATTGRGAKNRGADIITSAFLAAAFVTAAVERLTSLAAGVALLASSTAYYFYRMERRIQFLIKAAESAMGPLQDSLATQLDLGALRLISHVEHGQAGQWKYSKVIRLLYLTVGSAFLLGLAYILWPTVDSPTEPVRFNVVVEALLGAFLVYTGFQMITRSQPAAEHGGPAALSGSVVVLAWICVLAGITLICHLAFGRL